MHLVKTVTTLTAKMSKFARKENVYAHLEKEVKDLHVHQMELFSVMCAMQDIIKLLNIATLISANAIGQMVKTWVQE